MMILGQLVVVDPIDHRQIGILGGAEISTRLAPALDVPRLFPSTVKRPVHSSAMSTARSFHGSFAGSRIAVTLIGPLPTIDRVALDLHFAGKAAMHGIEAQQMGIGLDRSEIVDGDNLDVLAA